MDSNLIIDDNTVYEIDPDCKVVSDGRKSRKNLRNTSMGRRVESKNIISILFIVLFCRI